MLSLTAPSKVRLLDCCVEEPNGDMSVKPDFSKEHNVTVPKPVRDEDKCTGCGNDIRYERSITGIVVNRSEGAATTSLPKRSALHQIETGSSTI